MAKALFVAGLLAFWAGLLSEIFFIMAPLTAVSGSDKAAPTSTYGLVVWGCIAAGSICWIGAAAVLVRAYLKRRV